MIPAPTDRASTMFQTTRRSLLSLIAGLPIFRGARTDVPDTFSLVPGDTDGLVMRYRQDMRHVRNGALGHHSRAVVSLEILLREDDVWVARWTTERAELVDADPRMRPMLQALQAMWEGVPVDLALDGDGQVIGLADPEKMRALATTSMDRMIAMLTADPARAPLAPAIRAAMQPVLGSDAYLTGALTKEPAILLGAMGRAFRVGQPLELRSTLPSPLGTDEIPVLGRFNVRGIDAERRRAELGWMMVVDRPRMAQSIAAGVQEMAGRMAAISPNVDPSAAAAAVQGAVLDFDDRADFIVDTATAWPIRVRHVRRVSSGPVSREDTIELVRMGDAGA
jgi:hypothetical protein